MYKYIFGPVPSRRLGMSLGVDLVPHKVCSLDCVYCECGPTTKRTLDRKEYVLYGKVTEELDHFFIENPDPDFITFSGSGEPTLNTRIGDVLHFIKQKKPAIPVAVLTNGTLLGRKDVRDELMEADVVLPSLDAATPEVFRRINRPAHGLDLDEILEGLVSFRKEFRGEMWLEIFIIPGFN
ncbi:MAG: radical SAM protein, partial [Bacteroidetes bacterium]